MRYSIIISFAAVAALSSSCGGGPPADLANKAVEQAVREARSDVFDGGPESIEVIGIQLAGWKASEMPGNAGATVEIWQSDWKAKLRFREPVGYILGEVEGTRIVRVLADKGEELEFAGAAHGGKLGSNWDVGAHAQLEGDLGPWKRLWDKAGEVTMFYQVRARGMQTQTMMRGSAFKAMSKLQPCVIEGSEEDKKLGAAIAEQERKDIEVAQERVRQRQLAADAQQKQQQAERERLQAEAVEKQKQAEAERQRLQAEAVEKQKVAREAAVKLAADQKHAKLLAVMAPLQGESGAVVATDAGPTMSTIVRTCTVDAEKLTVAGTAIDLRSLPFREFPFEGAVDARGAFSWKAGAEAAPVVFALSGKRLASRGGPTISPLTADERKLVDAALADGERLAKATEVKVEVELIEAAAAKEREPQLALAALPGIVLYRDRVNAGLQPLFAGSLAANKTFAWKAGEVVALRLGAPVKGKGLYIRGTGAASNDLVVTVNGVHRATVATIGKLGGALLTFPGELEVFDLRFEAKGQVSVRTIGLLQ